MSAVQSRWRWLARLPGHIALFLGILITGYVLFFTIRLKVVNIYSIIAFTLGILSIVVGIHVISTSSGWRWLARLPGHIMLFLGVLVTGSVLLFTVLVEVINIYSIIAFAGGTSSIGFGVYVISTR